MPTSKIQAALVSSTRIKESKYDDGQDFLEAIIDKANTLDDDAWSELSEDAQLWINAGIKALKAKKRIPEFPDMGKVKPGADEDEDERPAKKKKKVVEEEDEDEDEKPRRQVRRTSRDEEDEEEDERPAKKKRKVEEEDEDEEEEAPKKKKKPAAEEEDEEEEDEKPAKKKSKAAAEEEDEEEDDKPAKKKKAEVADPSGTGVKVDIKKLIVENTELTVDEIMKKLTKKGVSVSKVTVSNVRADFRHSLKVLKGMGKLKGVEI